MESRRDSPSSPEGAGAPPSDAGANEDFLFHLYRGSELLQDNRVHEAKEELERALGLSPRDPKGQDLLAVVYFRLGLYPKAIAIYEQLRTASPRDTALLLNLALCYLKTGEAASARKTLEELLEEVPTHSRAWGYLGLACERLDDLEAAQNAFERGGHDPMARRIAERRAKERPPTSAPPAGRRATPPPPTRIAAAIPQDDGDAKKPGSFQELDAGEAFALTDSARHQAAAPVAPPDERDDDEPAPPRRPTDKPDTRDGPPPIGAVRVAQPTGLVNRRPTLIAPAPPAANAEGFEGSLPLIPSDHGRAIRVEEMAGAPVVAPSPPLAATRPPPVDPAGRRTLPPPLSVPTHSAAPPASTLTRDSIALFPASAGLVMHSAGLALVRTGRAGFAVRLEALRAATTGLSTKVLERQTKGKGTGEPLGGGASPLALATNAAQLVLGPRAHRKLSPFVLEDETCFVREDVLLGFDAALAHENGRIGAGDGEQLSVVKLEGKGAVLLETPSEILTLDVTAEEGMLVRREVVLGWFGLLVPRALGPEDAPSGQRGLVSFSGTGRLLVATT